MFNQGLWLRLTILWTRSTIDRESSAMTEPRYPNESPEYREARDRLLEEEKALIEQVGRVAELRRQLPPGGRLKEDYQFQWANEGRVGQPVRLSELFGDKPTLLLYNFMYGPGWDKPCLSCTSLMDGFDRTAYQVSQDAAFCGIAKAPAEKINAWARTRGWSQINLVSGFGTNYQADYRCQGKTTKCNCPCCTCSGSGTATSTIFGEPSCRATTSTPSGPTGT
ncbi:DUF899 family protein [Microbulbifer taiwanensis]